LSGDGRSNVFGDYELLAEIARGGMGVVYKARQTQLNRIVAVKMILAGELADRDDVRRFLVEAEAAAGLDHPAIVPVYECGQIEGRHFFSMGFIDGQSLAGLLAAGPLPPREAAAMLLRVAEAVNYAHGRGVIHRDLKPSNILLDRDGQPRVSDFGLAKRVTGNSGLTHTGQALGTPSYMPPEQAAGKLAEIGPASDVYALGAVLYAMLTGRPPFQAATPLDTLRQSLEQEPVPPRRLNANVPRDLETIALKCLQKQPRKRYATAQELAEELRRFLAGEPIRARRASQTERLWRWAGRNKSLAASLGAVALLLMLATAGATVAAAYFRQQKGVESALASDKTELAEKYASAAKSAEAAQRQAETTLADMQTTQGVLAAERGDAGTALVWFANAAGLTPHDPNRQRENRLRAVNWMRETTLPIAAIALEQTPKLAQFQPYGSLLLTLGRGGRCLVWDVRDDAPLPWTDGLTNVAAACWSPDGGRIAVGPTTGALPGLVQSRLVQVRAATSGGVIAQVVHPEPITSLAFSPDGRRLAIAGRLVQVWRLDDDNPVLEHEWPHPQWVDSLMFDSAGTRLIASCRDKLVRVYSTAPGSHEPAPLYAPLPHNPRRSTLVLADPGPPALLKGDRWLVTIVKNGQDGQIGELGWWDMQTGRAAPVGNIDPPSVTLLNRLVSSADGERLALAGSPACQVWDFSKSPVRSFLATHRNEVNDVRFSPDGTTILTASWDQTAPLWSVATGERIGPALGHTKIVNACGFSSDGRLSLTVLSDGLLRVWAPPAFDDGFMRPTALPYSLEMRPRLSSDGRLTAPGALHESVFDSIIHRVKEVIVVDLDTGKPAGPTIGLDGSLVDSCVCAGDRSVAIATADGTKGSLRICDIATGRDLMPPRPLPSAPCSVAARPGETQVAVLCEGGEFLLFNAGDAAPGLTRKYAPAQHQHARTTYTPDGKTSITVLDSDHSIWVCDADTLRQRFPPIRPVLKRGPVRAIDVSSDSNLLATAVNGKNAVQVWSLATGRPLSVPLEHPGDVYGLFAVRFSPDGRFLLSAHRDGQVRYWDWRRATLACPALKHDSEVPDAAFSPDGAHAVTGCSAGGARIWELATGKLVAPPMPMSWGIRTIDVRGPRVLLGAGPYSKVLDLEGLLAPPKMAAEELQLIGEIATAERIELGDRSALADEQWIARWRQWREGAAGAAESLAERLDAENDPRGRQIIIDRAARSPRVLRALARLRPDEPLRRAGPAREAVARGEYFAAHGRWNEAADNWREALRLDPSDDLKWLKTAALLAVAGDRVGHREHCQEMLRRFSATNDPLTADKLAKGCALLSEAVDDFRVVADLAERSVALGADGVWGPVLQLTKALADYRAGQTQAAARRLRSLDADLLAAEFRASYHIVSALVAHRQGDDAAARSQLGEGSDLIRGAVPDFTAPGTFQQDWVIAEVLRREAAQMISNP
jgi:eukaryotic-like serine/threonine-protein kinase